MLRTVLGCGLVISLCGGLAADDKAEKIDAKKLVGTWELKDKEKGATLVVGFTKDGKAHFAVTIKGENLRADGSYKLEGNKLTTTSNFGDKDRTETHTILKLTDTELVTKDEKGKEDKLLRVKGK
jgi:uncharacterized protein (TIGR03066 family)